MRHLLVFLVLSLSLPLNGPLHAQSQAEMTAQSVADFDKADKVLNDIYQQAMKAQEDDIAKQKLIAAQKAWIKFRDA